MKLKDMLLSIAAGLLIAAIILFVIASWASAEQLVGVAMTVIMTLFIVLSLIGFCIPVKEHNNKHHVSKADMDRLESDSERMTITGYKRYSVKSIVVPICDIDAENGFFM